MRKMRTVLASFAAFSLVLAACGDDDDSAESDTGTAETGAATSPPRRVATPPPPRRWRHCHRRDGRRHRHRRNGWRHGHCRAGHRPHVPHDHPLRQRSLLVGRPSRHGRRVEDLGVECVWMESVNDPGVQVRLIEQAVAEGSDGIASALASPDQLIPPLQAAVAAGIPVITLNSGSNDYQSIGALGHVGQTEFIAGQAPVSGSTTWVRPRSCADVRKSRTWRSRSAATASPTRSRVKWSPSSSASTPTRPSSRTRSPRRSPPTRHRRLHGHRPGHRHVRPQRRDRRRQGAGGHRRLRHHAGDHRGHFGRDDRLTIDQQQYLQGYLPILLYLYVTNLNTPAAVSRSSPARASSTSRTPTRSRRS